MFFLKKKLFTKWNNENQNFLLEMIQNLERDEIYSMIFCFFKRVQDIGYSKYIRMKLKTFAIEVFTEAKCYRVLNSPLVSTLSYKIHCLQFIFFW